MITTEMLNTMLQTGMLAFTVPVVLIAVWKLRTRKSLVPFFIGMLTFVVAAKVLETIPHTVFIIMDNPVSRLLKSNAALYALYGGLMAALFEEGGRYVAFHFLIRKYPEKETAVTYGIGHGGVECMLVLGLGYLQYYTYGQLLNNGTFDKMLKTMSGSELKAMQTVGDTIRDLTATDCLIAGWERISALMLQIGLSILVFKAVKVAGQKKMLWIAMILHMLADIPAGLYQMKAIGLIPTEILLTVLSLAVLLYAMQVYKGIKKEAKEASTFGASGTSIHELANRKLKDKE